MLVGVRNGKVGLIDYKVNLNRYFYKYVSPYPLDEINAELKVFETGITELLKEVTT